MDGRKTDAIDTGSSVDNRGDCNHACAPVQNGVVACVGGGCAIGPGDRGGEALAGVPRAEMDSLPDRIYLYFMLAHVRGRLCGTVSPIRGRAPLGRGVSRAGLHDEPSALAPLPGDARAADLAAALPRLDRDGAPTPRRTCR